MNLNDPNTLLLLLLVALGSALLVGTLVYFLSQRKSRDHQTQLAEQFQQREALLSEQYQESKEALSTAQEAVARLQEQQLVNHQKLGELELQKEQLASVQQERLNLQQQLQQAQHNAGELRTQLESQAARHEQEKLASDEKLTLLSSAEKRLQEQFENLANKIFEQKNEKFSQTSKAGLDALLSPLKEQIEGFKKQVSDQYVKEGQERASLKTEILNLKELNQKITEEASALTKALKGDNKQQGNWGEVVLERILKESGLREGHEFETQVSMKNEQGKLYQPDVVVHLPNDKDIVIDSKMSLAAYERFFNEQEDEVARQQHLAEHIASLRNHIKELGKKDYQDLQGLRTLDYVLMFIPVESAFLLAIDQAPELYKLALDNNIMLVSPTNLLVALKTINHIWQNEHRNQNAQKIADSAKKLYEKFHGFVSDMDKVGRGLDTVQKAYGDSMNKLTEGRGNIVRQLEQFREMGVQTNKKLDEKLLDKAGLDPSSKEQQSET